MSDLIDRQAALDALRRCQPYLYDARDPELKIKLSSAKAAINNLSTIQPEKAQLSQEGTTKDTISRQAARHALCKAVHKGEDIPCENQTASCLWTGTRVCDFVREIDALPPIQPEPQWIPVSKRLPEDLSEVNVTWVNHNPEPYYEFTKDKPFTATAVYYKGEWYWYSATCVDYLAEYGRCDWNKVDEAIEIIAWMPLPKPFEGGIK